MIRPWKKIASVPRGDLRIFTAREDEKISPRTGQAHHFVVLESSDWVNVIALTPDRHLVLVEQYRHGTDTVELEIPGGLIGPRGETPVEAALRELREETGYEGDAAQVLCEVLPNPAFLNNRCYTVLVQNCQRKHPLDWDHGEDLLTRLVPATEVDDLVATGRIRHSVILAALYHFALWRKTHWG